MNVTNFRLGNYIYHPLLHEIHVVTELSFNAAKSQHYETIGIVSNYTAINGDVDFHPIRIDDAWLLKLGFDKGRKIYHDEYIEVRRAFEGLYVLVKIIDSDNKEVAVRNFFYVHELQNLYFALTGEELTLKETA